MSKPKLVETEAEMRELRINRVTAIDERSADGDAALRIRGSSSAASSI